MKRNTKQYIIQYVDRKLTSLLKHKQRCHQINKKLLVVLSQRTKMKLKLNYHTCYNSPNA